MVISIVILVRSSLEHELTKKTHSHATSSVMTRLKKHQFTSYRSDLKSHPLFAGPIEHWHATLYSNATTARY